MVLLFDSIAEADERARGHVLVCGSHGGASAARYALALRPRLVVSNDAGVGKDGAGLAALALLQEAGIAAATVAHTSARIGDARSTLEEGVISHANAFAQAMRFGPGRALRDALGSEL